MGDVRPSCGVNFYRGATLAKFASKFDQKQTDDIMLVHHAGHGKLVLVRSQARLFLEHERRRRQVSMLGSLFIT